MTRSHDLCHQSCSIHFAAAYQTKVGGSKYRSYKTWLLNVIDMQFTELQARTIRLQRSACGYIRRPSGEIEVVILGGERDSGDGGRTLETEIYSLKDDNWRAGPQIPGKTNPKSIQNSRKWNILFLQGFA